MTSISTKLAQPYEKIGRRLAVWRVTMKVRNYDCARACGVTPQTFSKWVEGQVRPEVLTALRLEILTQGAVCARDWYATEHTEARALGFELFAKVHES
jgi:transcriptional regulator with XRE-family HTH domain